MPGLDTSLSIGVQSLLAQEGALQITNNNIANANTPGYSREIVDFEQVGPNGTGGGALGNGVVLQGYQSIRDELLQLRIGQQTSDQGSANAQLNSLSQVQPAFIPSTIDVGTQMSNFFASVSALSTNPSDSTARQAVLSAGQNLATSFHTTAGSLTRQQTSLDSQVQQDVSQVNNLSSQIAAVSRQIAQAKGTGQNTGTLQDQQDQLVLSLSKLTDVSVTHTESGDTVTTGNGTALVSGGQSLQLKTTTGSNGFQHVLDSNGNDVTTSIKGGDLGGSIQTRDQTIAGLLTNLDTLASQFAGAINTAQSKGFDLNGAPGQPLFTVPGVVAGSAAGITMSATSPNAVAASSDGTAGSNGNLVNLLGVQTANLPAGQNPTNAYAAIVFQVGTAAADAQANSTATSASLLQLTNQRNAVSGVSVDEESTNLIRYQQAYEAAARVITTVQTLIGVTLAMGTAAAA
ncbi:MAG TPA: flagellar hook-associated protein FlgK [Acidisarcina sp.]